MNCALCNGLVAWDTVFVRNPVTGETAHQFCVQFFVRASQISQRVIGPVMTKVVPQ